MTRVVLEHNLKWEHFQMNLEAMARAIVTIQYSCNYTITDFGREEQKRVYSPLRIWKISHGESSAAARNAQLRLAPYSPITTTLQQPHSERH